MFIGAGPLSVARVTTSFGLARSIGGLRLVRLTWGSSPVAVDGHLCISMGALPAFHSAATPSARLPSARLIATCAGAKQRRVSRAWLQPASGFALPVRGGDGDGGRWTLVTPGNLKESGESRKVCPFRWERHMKNTRVIAVVVGLLLLLPGLGLLVGGGSLGLINAFGRDESGYFAQRASLIATSSAAVTTDDLAFVLDPQVPAWVAGMFDTDVRLRATATDTNRAIFIGIAQTSDVERYLSGVGHDVIINPVGASPTYRSVSGTARVSPPAGQGFWAATASGTGTQELTWRPTNGHWAIAVANADGSPGVAAEATVGIRVGSLLPIALLLLAAGVVLTLGGALLTRFGVKRPADHICDAPQSPTAATSGGTGSQLSAAGTPSGSRNQP